MPTPPRKTDTTVKIKEGENTKSQAQLMGRVFGYVSFDYGFDDAPKGDITTYRRMRNNPTIALAREIANAPIKTAAWSLENKEGVPEEAIEFVQNTIEHVWPLLIVDMLRARDYGYQGFEKVWELKEGKWVYKKLKGLLPEITQVAIGKDKNWNFDGIIQRDVHLPIEKSLWYSYDADIGNWYGRSWFENIREHAWTHWNDTSTKFLKQYIKKVAGTIPIVHYPIGESENVQGETKSNYELAISILSKLGSGAGVAIPQELIGFAEEFIRSGANIKDLLAWQISFLETRSTHGQDFLGILKYYDSLLMRGLLVPERVGTEGQHGTKAEAGEHADIALTISDIVFQDIVRVINWYVVNPLLVYNYGVEAENSIWIKREGLDPDMKIFFRTIMEKILTSPTNMDLVQAWMDVNSMFDALGIPKTDDTLEPVEQLPEDGIEDGKVKEEEEEILASILQGQFK